MTRCKLLATALDRYTMRCPTTPTRFHYHGIDPKTTGVMTGSAPCEHRHKTGKAARVCSEKLTWAYIKTRCQEVSKVYGPEGIDVVDAGTMCDKPAVARFHYKQSNVPIYGLRVCQDHADAYRTHFSDNYDEIAL
jgi:hypothetical protein